MKVVDSILQKKKALHSACLILEQIELMKKSILAKAFRGELGTNNPDDENSVELLKRMIEGVDNK
jgi:type I restriction enzyme S subunit